MNRYKIYLGLNNPNTNKEYNANGVIKDIKWLFDYATIYRAKGLYKNEIETTLVIEIVSNDFSDSNIRNICKYLKNIYQQECVMYTKDTIDMEVI